MRNSPLKQDLQSGLNLNQVPHHLQTSHYSHLTGPHKQGGFGKELDKTQAYKFNNSNNSTHQQPQQQQNLQQHNQHQIAAMPEQDNNPELWKYRNSFLQPFQTSMDYTDSIESKQNNNNNNKNNSRTENILHNFSQSMDEEPYEEIDEDNMSDFEEEEAMMHQIFNSHKKHNQQHFARMDEASTLLRFAENVTNELQKYLHRNKEQDDSCDIYEDKWATTKSGRELYYADLLRIAQGEPEPSSSTSRKASKKSSSSKSCNTISNSSSPSSARAIHDGNDLTESERYKGYREASVGLGPLEELFEHGLKNGNVSGKIMTSSIAFQQTYTTSSLHHHHHGKNMQVYSDLNAPTPMNERFLPESFWKEPRPSKEHQEAIPYNNNSKGENSNNQQQRGLYLVNQKLPDFTDLMESWHGGGSDNK